MNFTQEQVKQILQEVVEEQDGFNKLMKMTLEIFMRSERKIYQEETGLYANGFRTRKVKGFGKEIALSVPRTRSGGFYPILLAIIRDEDEECQLNQRVFLVGNIFHKQQYQYIIFVLACIHASSKFITTCP